MTNLREQYTKTVRPELIKEFSLKNVLTAPKIEKVVVNVGLGRMSSQQQYAKMLPEVEKWLAMITGQKPSQRPARKSIAGFKLREGTVVGIATTLRRGRMYDFLEKVINVVFPRLRDFKGISLKNVDKQGNLNFGFKEHAVFPEIDLDDVHADFGLQVTVVTSAKTREQAIALYRKLGFIFKEDNQK
jgi:large subunit ribosomal protein L5